ncbi:MAG: hypothetical protein HXX17_17055, partial [Geobacteraceae bacterium]|nr:hypothetical protein [Geobacteraceae bacterium]
MKKIFLSLLLLFTALCTADVQTSHGALSSLSGAVNASYTCSPPFVSQAAKPLI